MKIEELLDILNEEKDKTSKLIEVLREKRDLIEKKDTDGIKRILIVEKQSIDELNLLEKQRNEVTKDLSEALDAEPTVSGILEKIEEPHRHNLTLIAARLTELLNEVSLLNVGIQQMIAYRIEEFDMVMDVLRGKHDTYNENEKNLAGTIFNGRA